MMKTLDQEEQSLLAAARRGMSPTPADRARVRFAISAAIIGATPTTLGQPSAETGAALRAAGSHAAAWSTKLLAGTLVAATAFGAGYWTGRRSASRATRITQPALPAIAARASAATAPAPIDPPTPAIPRQVPLPNGVTPPGSGSAAAQRRATLEDEVRTLRRVERALRDGNPRLARSLLAELDHAVPGGTLVEERRAASVMAACQLDEPTSAKAAADFISLYPTSAYLARLRQTCATSAPATESRVERTDPALPGDSSKSGGSVK
jgi:hypothetical protein